MPYTHTTIANLRAAHSPHIGDMDCTLLIAHALRTDRVHVLTHPHTPIPPAMHRRIATWCRKRASGYPLAYMTGVKEFYGRTFAVTPSTLIPRPETESLVDHAVAVVRAIPPDVRIVVADIGTGSGAIAITLAHILHASHPAITLFASDISRGALRIAQRNADTRVKFFHSDLLARGALCTRLLAHTPTHLVVVANLPYVDSALQSRLYAATASRALQFEPPQALWSPDGGLAHYRTLIAHTRTLHTALPQTHITSLYEIDPSQTQALAVLLAPAPHTPLPDLAGQHRFHRWDIVPDVTHTT